MLPKKAYGTVAYLRVELNDGNISSFVASKGRGAPLKTLSIPRLELMGALLSYKLFQFRSCFRLDRRSLPSMSPTIYSKEIQAIRHLEVK
ncbi:hypothetical protein TNCV_1367881 [Trichonephila clavipes]|nr:hypothetical protein TNCV_1367881 [Trichonephila clavipes]